MFQTPDARYVFQYIAKNVETLALPWVGSHPKKMRMSPGWVWTENVDTHIFQVFSTHDFCRKKPKVSIHKWFSSNMLKLSTHHLQSVEVCGGVVEMPCAASVAQRCRVASSARCAEAQPRQRKKKHQLVADRLNIRWVIDSDRLETSSTKILKHLETTNQIAVLAFCPSRSRLGCCPTICRCCGWMRVWRPPSSLKVDNHINKHIY